MSDVVMAEAAHSSPKPEPVPKIEDVTTTQDSILNAKEEPKEAASPMKPSPSFSPTAADAAASEANGLFEEAPMLRPQQLPLPPKLRQYKPPPPHVIVLAFGSHSIRYGFASDSTPKKLFPAVAFPRRPGARNNDTAHAALSIPPQVVREDEAVEEAEANFDDVCETIVEELLLNERRRGGGKPIPWRVEVEPVVDDNWRNDAWLRTENAWTFDKGDIIVGRDVLTLQRDSRRAASYDIVLPMWDGKITFGCGASNNLVRRAWDVLLDHIVKDLELHRAERKLKVKGDVSGAKDDADLMKQHDEFITAHPKHATSFVTLVMPEASQRRDFAELVAAVFRSRSLKCAAVFAHQSAVSCALGAGLATCAVVDIGHSATVIACVEDGIVCGESRIHLRYGSYHVQRAFEHLLTKHSNFHDVVVRRYEHTNEETVPVVETEEAWLVTRTCEQACGFKVDENDSMKVTQVKGPSSRSLRVLLGVGLRAVPTYGLIYPLLLKAAVERLPTKSDIPERNTFERNSEDDNFVGDIFNDLRRSGIATAALPIGLFANDKGQPAEHKVNAETASIIDAIIWSIARAIEVKRPDQQTRTPDHYRRYLNAIVLAGGGASIDGIAQALEGRIKKGFQDAGVMISDVTVIDGGKGKGDEELAAAAAVLKDVEEGGLLDDTDTASLPWKGGAVMVEADAVNDYWVYRDDWDARNVRALRERVPFYW